jgi:hypothetical protein
MNGNRDLSRRPEATLGGVLAFCAVFLCATLIAQPVPPGGGGRGKRPPPKKDDPTKSVDNRPQGSDRGMIISYKPPKDSDDEDLAGVLTFRVDGQRGIRKINVRRSDPVKFQFGGEVEFDPEEYPELLIKNLFCNVTWKVEDPEAKKKTRVLTAVSFDPIDISGKIEEITPTEFIIKGAPKDHREWPAMSKPGDKRGQRPSEVGRRVPVKKLKLRVFEDITKFNDASNQPLDPEDFELKQDVEATLVYAGKGGILLAVRPPVAGGAEDGEGRSGGGGRGGRGGPTGR